MPRCWSNLPKSRSYAARNRPLSCSAAGVVGNTHEILDEKSDDVSTSNSFALHGYERRSNSTGVSPLVWKTGSRIRLTIAPGIESRILIRVCPGLISATWLRPGQLRVRLRTSDSIISTA